MYQFMADLRYKQLRYSPGHDQLDRCTQLLLDANQHTINHGSGAAHDTCPHALDRIGVQRP